MRFGLSVPIFGEFGDVRRLADLAAQAESLGWDGFFTWDHLVHPWPGAGRTVDSTVVLTAVALATERVKFGPMVIPLARRRPAKIARELATLDHLSGGRLILSVGLGDAPQEFDNLGEASDHRTRAEMLDEALEVVTGLWSGERIDHEGRFYTARDAQFDPPSVQQPRIPVWVGGTWPRKGPLRRALRWDGYVPLVHRGVITAADVRAMAAEIDKPGFDLVVTEYGVNTGAATPAEAEAAGAAWWIQSVFPWHEGRPIEDFLAALRRGPQR